jgi:hypothetical protein
MEKDANASQETLWKLGRVKLIKRQRMPSMQPKKPCQHMDLKAKFFGMHFN